MLQHPHASSTVANDARATHTNGRVTMEHAFCSDAIA